MAERHFAVELTASFLSSLESIEAFLTEADAGHVYADLLTQLRGEIIPNLRRFPNMGRLYLDTPPRSVEALSLLASLPPGAAARLRIYLAGDYLILYIVDESHRLANLLSIRHHRQLSFDFEKIWSNHS